ncbi:protein Star-like [Daphnia pulicaria]|uniref:protein Star-like n=1 Tax=Daphnia pulicaria TaxID=35523 RepID=UPI001EEBBDED|nr:protein Star-like [Daphnia pulicaria]
MTTLRSIRLFVIRHRSLLLSTVSIGLILIIAWPSTDSRHNSKQTKKKVLYNLMEETKGMPKHVKDCTIEYANAHKLQQDHPCLLDIIRRQHLNKPSPSDVPLFLDYPNVKDPSAGQVTAVLRLLRNLTNGFFIESGAADGESFSNTLFLEREMNWTGLLVEPEPKSFQNLVKRNRKSWTLQNCLSLEKYPTEVSFDKTEITGKIIGSKVSQSELDNGKLANVQCFPLYSILLAHGQNWVDFFSLDVEGHELQVLKTIPWHKVNITLIAVEWEHVEEGYYAIVDYMKEQGYVNFGRIATPYARDVVFIKDFLDDLRFDYVDYDDE